MQLIALSKIGGSTDELQVDLVCCAEDGTFDRGTPGVWFLLEGTGARVQLSTCAEETKFGSRITIFSGDDRNGRACMTSTKTPEPNCPFTNSSSLELDTFEGTTYYILVHDQVSADSGNFGLSITDRTEPPEKYSCDTAVELVDDSVVQGTTFGATINGGLQCARCIEGGPQNPGLFYHISVKEADTEVSVIICSKIVSSYISIYYVMTSCVLKSSQSLAQRIVASANFGCSPSMSILPLLLSQQTVKEQPLFFRSIVDEA
jgi:hypothetical protein